ELDAPRLIRGPPAVRLAAILAHVPAPARCDVAALTGTAIRKLAIAARAGERLRTVRQRETWRLVQQVTKIAKLARFAARALSRNDGHRSIVGCLSAFRVGRGCRRLAREAQQSR